MFFDDTDDESFMQGRKPKKNAVSIRIVIEGPKIKNTAYPQWMVTKAKQLGVDGWVREKREGIIESMLVGEQAAVLELIQACYQGSSTAIVKKVKQFPQHDVVKVETGFHQLSG